MTFGHLRRLAAMLARGITAPLWGTPPDPHGPEPPADSARCQTQDLSHPRKARAMLFHPIAAGFTAALSTQSLVSYLQGLFGPLFLGIVGIVAIFFLFTREITRFVQFVVLAIAIAVIFYTPGIIHTLAQGIANALGVH